MEGLEAQSWFVSGPVQCALDPIHKDSLVCVRRQHVINLALEAVVQ